MVSLKQKNNFCFKKLFFCFAVFFLLFSLPKFVWADTTISSDLDITSDTVWTKEASPYLISGDISVETGATLKIEPGTQIEFQKKNWICLFGGNLDIEGDDSDKVSIDADTGQYWGIDNVGGKMTVKNAELSDLYDIEGDSQSYNDISFSDISLNKSFYMFDGGFLSIDGGKISSDTTDAISIFDSTKTYLSNTEISGGPDGNALVQVYDSEIHIDNAIFDYSLTKALITFNSSVTVLNSKFEGGLSDGLALYTDYPYDQISNINIAYSDISNFKGTALIDYGANVTIKESDIFANNVGFIFNPLENDEVTAQHFIAHKNNIVGNSLGARFNGDYDDTKNTFDVTNNFWGDASGPFDAGGPNDPSNKGNPTGAGDTAFGWIDMIPTYTPWLTVLATHAKHNPVIIIPGILSSYLDKDDGTEVWPNLAKTAIDPNNHYLDDLQLNDDGTNSSVEIKVGDILRSQGSINGFKIPIVYTDFFQGLISKLSEQYVEGQDLFVFPYDWRLDVDSVAQQKLSLFIENVLEQSGSEKVDIIAHSMGGLVTKSYIKDFGGSKIGKFIDIATPHLGSPSSLKTLSYGDDLGIAIPFHSLIDPNEIKKISQNFPSVYELLPSEKYFDSENSDYKYYLDDLGDTDNNKIKGKLDFSQTLDFLKNSGRNSLLVDQAKDYQEGIVNVDPQASGIETINIVGCGTPTIGKIFTLPKKDTKNEYSLSYINGDGTVPLKSAEALNSEKTYYVSGGIAHGTMPSFQGVKDLVSSILIGKDIMVDKNVDTTTSNCKLPNGKYVSVHSPVKIDVYDGDGNHSGPNENGNIEQNIPGVIYDTIEDNKFVFIPDGENYKINLKATDLGSFSVDVKTEKDGVDQYDYFNDIPINTITLSGNIDLSSSTPTLTIKKDGNSESKILLPDISSNVDLNEVEKVEPIQTVSTSTPISTLVQNLVHHHSQGAHGNLVVSVIQTINSSTPISILPSLKFLTVADNKSPKVTLKTKLAVASSTKEIVNPNKSNLAGVLSGYNNFKGWGFVEKIADYKNRVWNFVIKMFHFKK